MTIGDDGVPEGGTKDTFNDVGNTEKDPDATVLGTTCPAGYECFPAEIGKPCGQRVSLDFRIPNATRAVHGGYRVRLMFLHSYEHFGNFTTRLEVAETGLVKHKRLSGAWTSRTSVPSPEVIATLPVSAKGRRLRLSITAPWKGASGDSKIAITGLRVLELGR